MILNNLAYQNNEQLSAKVIALIDKLNTSNDLSRDEYLFLLENISQTEKEYLFSLARAKRSIYFQNKVYIRGLIEYTNICRQDCFYCGIRKSNENVERYRYSVEEIKEIIDRGYTKGYKTFVLQGGEDLGFSTSELATVLTYVKSTYHDVAVTLSIGERDFSDYEKLKEAGMDRFLLRHETASKELYSKLHPSDMSYDNRFACLNELKRLGVQVGAGFMVNSPGQENKDLVNDLMFIREFSPEMIGIGPFVSHHDTPFKDETSGTSDQTVILHALARLTCPKALIPSTTATSSVDPLGRKKALNAGCNVIMINLSNENKRQNYTLYDNKSYKGDESDEFKAIIKKDIEEVGLVMVNEVGHHPDKEVK